MCLKLATITLPKALPTIFISVTDVPSENIFRMIEISAAKMVLLAGNGLGTVFKFKFVRNLKNKIMRKLRLLLFAPIGSACILFGTGCSQKATVPPAIPLELKSEKNWKFESTPMWEDNFSNNGAP